jgi:integrase/recombinase XerD
MKLRLTELEFLLEDFLNFCETKNLSKKTTASYEQTLKLFLLYLKDEHEVEDPKDVKAGHIRLYIKY